ncbi:MAG: hypothetical protein ACM338_10235 [Betaproteobacteria bacterium]
MPDAHDFLVRFWADLLARPMGPFGFRFVLQPVLATLLAFRDGTRDARTRASPYFWSLIHEPTQRRAHVVEALRATAKVLGLGVFLDAMFQVRAFGTFLYPVETLVVVLSLCFLPYVLMRGPADRIARQRLTRGVRREGLPPQHPES